jgi:rod shape-determining protein MreD
MSVLGADHRRELGVRQYPFLIYAMTPIAALVLQALLPMVFKSWMPLWVPVWMPRLIQFDLPMVVTVYFALVRRDPIQGTLMGASLGLFEDALTQHAIGVNGVAKTVAGFLAGSVGVRIDVENHTIRLMLTFLLSILCSAIYVFIYRVLLGLDLEWSWLPELMKAVGNSAIAAALFPLLDRAQIRE